MSSRRRPLPTLAAALAVLLCARGALAAACCMSATSFGVGRLRIWEEVAAGVQLGHARSLGQWDAAGALRLNGSSLVDGLSQVQPWVIVRLHERVQLSAWAPLLLNDRRVGDQGQLAGGLGDLGAAVRGELVSLGQYDGLPSFAVTLGALAPTGRRPEQTSPPLFAGTTGRGAWGLSVAVESEYAFLPWFVRVDAGATWLLPFVRPDTGARQRYGAQLAAALSGGRELLADRLITALSLSAEWEGALELDGVEQPASRARSLTLAASLSWVVDPHWTLVGGVTNGLWPGGAGQNRDARLGLTFGVRHAWF